jgi:hypothetical protein
MTLLRAATTFAFVLFLPILVPDLLSMMPQAEAAASDAMLLKCRKAVFRAYGQRQVQADGRRVRTLNKDFVVRQVDQCVANGGRVR